MVISNPKMWISDADPETSIGILAFETATTMSRLVSLHCTLSDLEIKKLRSETMRSEGVAYLTSTDQSLLLRLVCAELVDDLDRTAGVVSRLSRRCRKSVEHVGFERVYADFKAGSIDPARFGPKVLGLKGVEKRFMKMEKMVATTSRLFKELEALAELEAAKRKLWDRFRGPKPKPKPSSIIPLLDLDIKSQNQKVRKLKELSLWNHSLDKAVEIMALSSYSIFLRICVVFGPSVPVLPKIALDKENSCVFFSKSHLKLPMSGPLERPRAAAKEVTFRNSCSIICSEDPELMINHASWCKMLEPELTSTVGRAGLALHYAKIILLVEHVAESVKEAEVERDELYKMLPMGLRLAVRGKLRDWWREPGPLDGRLADGWKEAVGRILGWIGPLARDTVEWQAERNMDQAGQRFDTQPRKLRVQTLHFADRVKVEAAIVEVLVGLSLVCWYDEQCS